MAVAVCIPWIEGRRPPCCATRSGPEIRLTSSRGMREEPSRQLCIAPAKTFVMRASRNPRLAPGESWLKSSMQACATQTSTSTPTALMSLAYGNEFPATIAMLRRRKIARRCSDHQLYPSLGGLRVHSRFRNSRRSQPQDIPGSRFSAVMSAQWIWNLSWPLKRAQESTSRGCLVTNNLQRQNDQVVVSPFDSAKIKPFNNRNISPQEDLMSPRFGSAKFLGREIVNTYELNPSVCHELGRVGRDIGEVFVKYGVHHPGIPAIPRTKQDSFRATPLVLVQFRCINRRSIG